MSRGGLESAPRFASSGNVVGVTGTNGKTSTAWLVAAGLEAAGRRTYVASTIGDRFGGDSLPPTPSFEALTQRLQELARAGAAGFVLECTSHALALGFAHRVVFDAAIFTNLTHEHIDQHCSWEHYLASKAQLFATGLRVDGTAILNAADEHSELLDEVLSRGTRRAWYGARSRGLMRRRPDLAVRATEVSAEGTRVALEPSAIAEQFRGELRVRLVGEVFAENAVAAALALVSVGVEPGAIHKAFAEMLPVPGRFEIVHRRPAVAIDYAHTPDALVRTCQTARRLAGAGRVIVVFGAGGNRDRGKRGPMGTAAGVHADVAIVTSDNPRDEDPPIIAATLARAARAPGRARVLVHLDRGRAIEAALDLTREEDVLVVCGKGHERGQIVAGRTLPFSDAEVIRELVARPRAIEESPK